MTDRELKKMSMMKQVLIWMVLCCLWPVGAMGATFGPFQVTTTVSNGVSLTGSVLTISKDGEYTISQNSSDEPSDVRIEITASNSVKIILDRVNIATSTVYYGQSGLSCSTNANITLELSGENRITGLSGQSDGINVKSSLKITGSGILKASAGRDTGSASQSGIEVGENIVIESGKVEANSSGSHEKGIQAKTISISGGTVLSNSGFKGTQYITGGSVKNAGSNVTTGELGTLVYKTTLKLNGLESETLIENLSIKDGSQTYQYGSKDIYTDQDGQIYLWLPAGTYGVSLEAGGTKYHNSYVTVYADQTNQYILADGTKKSIGYPLFPGMKSMSYEPVESDQAVTLKVTTTKVGAKVTLLAPESVAGKVFEGEGTELTYTFTMPDEDLDIKYSIAYYDVEALEDGVFNQTDNELQITKAGTYTIKNALGADKVCGMPIKVTRDVTGEVRIKLAGVNVESNWCLVSEATGNVILELEETNILSWTGDRDNSIKVTNDLLICGEGKLRMSGSKNAIEAGGSLSIESGLIETGQTIKAKTITVTGGTVLNSKNLDGTLTIAGGSVKTADIRNTKGEGEIPVYQTKLQLDGVEEETLIETISILPGNDKLAKEGYYKGMYTDKEGWLYLWLPVGTDHISLTTKGGKEYHNGYVTSHKDKSHQYLLVDGNKASISYPPLPKGLKSIILDYGNDKITMVVDCDFLGIAPVFTGLEEYGLSKPVVKEKELTYTFSMPTEDLDIGCSVEYYHVETEDGAIDQTSGKLKITKAGTYTISNALGMDNICDVPIEVTAESGEVLITLAGVNIQNKECPFDCGVGADVTLVLEEGTENIFENTYQMWAIYKGGSNNKLTIKGTGKLEAIAQWYYVGVCCCIGGNDKENNGTINIEGGQITLKNRDYQYGTIAGIRAQNLTISGGTIKTISRVFIQAIEACVIKGGSINGNINANSLGNGSQQLTQRTLQLLGISSNTPITVMDGLPDYGFNSVYTDEDSKLYLWLPSIPEDWKPYPAASSTKTPAFVSSGENVYYAVFFDKNDGAWGSGKPNDCQYYKHGAAVDVSGLEATKNGYLQDGWLVNDVKTTETSIPITESVTIKPNWMKRIESDQSYDESLKGIDVTIAKTGKLIVDSEVATLRSLTMEDGAQLDLQNGLTLTEGFNASYNVGTGWTTFYNPIEGGSVSVDSHWWATGYKTPISQQWNEESEIKSSIPYIVAAKSSDQPLSITKAGTTLSAMTDEPSGNESSLNTGIFLFKGNTMLKNIELKNVYVLNTDGTRFELRERETIKPFQAYIIANQETRNLFKSLPLGGGNTPTGLQQLLTGSFRAWGSHGRLMLESREPVDVAIYSLSGQLVRRLDGFSGNEQVELPQGIYFVRNGQMAVKVIL